MKVIDLLNKIANKEKLPKRIKYNETIYKYQKSIHEKGYVNTDEGYNEWLSDMLNDTEKDLNDEVEVLEDEEIDIQEIEELSDDIDEIGWFEVQKKINEIIRVVNKMQQENKMKEK